MMLEGGIYSYLIPVARTIAGFFVGALLGIFGGWMALTFNALVGYPWTQTAHLGIYVAGIGLGAGLGAYVGWINLSLGRPIVALTILLVIVGGIVGSVLGNLYGLEFIGPTYLGERDTRINLTHFGGAFGAIIVSTGFGLYYHFRTKG